MISYLLKRATNPSLNAAIQVAVARAREIKLLQAAYQRQTEFRQLSPIKPFLKPRWHR